MSASWLKLERPRRLLALGLVLAGLAALAASPPVRSGAKGVLLTLDILPTPASPLALLTPRPHRTEIALSTTRADLYRARGFTGPPPVLLVHGANPRGKDDRRVIDLADGIARSGRTVLVPNLSLRHERIDPADVQRITAGVQYLSPQGEVAVLAFSYGAALAVVGLADIPEQVRLLATVGTYYDLAHLITGVTTARVPYKDRLLGWEPHPDALDVLAEQISFFLEADEGRRLREAWASRDPEQLPPAAQAAYDLLVNRDPRRTQDLIEHLPSDLRHLLGELSPSRVAHRIRFPVHALHDRSDPAAPVSESRLLVEAVTADSKLAEVDLFDHVFPVVGPLGNLPDARRLATFAGTFLRTQEGWPRL